MALQTAKPYSFLMIIRIYNYKEEKKFKQEKPCNAVAIGFSMIFCCLKKYGHKFTEKSLQIRYYSWFQGFFSSKIIVSKNTDYLLLLYKKPQHFYLIIVTSCIDDMWIYKHFCNASVFYKGQKVLFMTINIKSNRVINLF